MDILEEQWCPALTIIHLVLSVQSLLGSPYYESPCQLAENLNQWKP